MTPRIAAILQDDENVDMPDFRAYLRVREIPNAGDNDGIDLAGLDAALATIGSEESLLEIPPGTLNVTADRTIPDNVQMWPRRGANMVVTLNKTISIESPAGIDAGAYPIISFDASYTFDGSTQVSGSPLTAGTFEIPLSLAPGAACLPEWLGAVHDGTTNDRAAVQASLDSVWQGGRVQFQTGSYHCEDTGRDDNLGDACAIWWTNDYGAGGHTSTPTDRPKLVVVGSGDYNSVIQCNNSEGYDNLAHFYGNGEGLDVFDASYNVTLDSGSRSTTCLKLQGNSIRAERLGTGGGDVGIHLYSCSPRTAVNGCWDEFSDIGLLIENSPGATSDDYESFEAVTAGIKVKMTSAGIGSLPLDQTLAPVVLVRPLCINGFAGTSSGITIDVESASRVAVEIVGAVLGANNLDPALRGAYAINVVKSYIDKWTGGQLFHVPYGCLFGTGYHTLSGMSVYQIGMFDQTSPFTVRAFDISSGAYWSAKNMTFDAIAGAAVYSLGQKTAIEESDFFDCANGGLGAGGTTRAGAVNSTVGDAVIVIKPQSASAVIILRRLHFYAPGSEKTGKIGILIDCSTAVPDPASGGMVLIEDNTMEPNSFDIPLKVTGATSAQVAQWTIRNCQLSAHANSLVPSGPVVATPLRVGAWANADAPNGSMFYSSDNANTVYKDSGGTVHDEY